MPMSLAVFVCLVLCSGAAAERQKWLFGLGGLETDYATTPSVSPDGARVYFSAGANFTQRGMFDPGNEDMLVYCLRADDGAQLWVFNASQHLLTMPCCNTHRTGITAPVLSPDGGALYFKAGLAFLGLHTNGTLKFAWNAIDKLVGMPAVSPDSRTLYVASVAYQDKVLCALDLTLPKAELYWSWRPCRWLARVWSSNGAVVSPDGATLYYGSEGGNATKLAARDGTKQWGFQIYPMDVGGMALSPDGSAVYVQYQTGGTYFALDATDGHQIWNHSFILTATAPAVSPDGATVYVTYDGAGAKVRAPDGTYHLVNSTLLALDTKTGVQKWSFNTTSQEAQLRSPVATATHVFLASETEGAVWGLRAADGRPEFAACLHLRGGVSSESATPSPDGRTVFVGAQNGLAAVDTRLGSIPSCKPKPEGPLRGIAGDWASQGLNI